MMPIARELLFNLKCDRSPFAALMDNRPCSRCGLPIRAHFKGGWFGVLVYHAYDGILIKDEYVEPKPKWTFVEDKRNVN